MPIKHVKLLQTIWTLCIALQFLLHFKFIGIAVKSMPIMKFVVFCDKIETNQNIYVQIPLLKNVPKLNTISKSMFVCACIWFALIICIQCSFLWPKTTSSIVAYDMQNIYFRFTIWYCRTCLNKLLFSFVCRREGWCHYPRCVYKIIQNDV